MNAIRVTWLLAGMAWSAVSGAREVELLDYTAPMSSSEVSDRSLSTPIASPGERVTLWELLEDEWPMLASSRPTIAEATVDVHSGVEAPLWMRTGVPPSRLGFRLISIRTSNCARPYRPRPDLHPETERRRSLLYPLVAQIACETGVSPILLDALIVQESRYLQSARSRVGAMGLTQLMPSTARQLGVVNAWSVAENVRGGARYLRRQLDEFGRVDLALAAYNAGPARVRRAGRVPPIRETLNYVATIMSALEAPN